MTLISFKNTYLLSVFLISFTLVSCAQKVQLKNKKLKISTGAEKTAMYVNLLKGKNVAVVANQTSVLFKDSKNKEPRHLVDSLLSLGITVKKVFAPEHGFRGKADAGEIIKNGIDAKTGVPIISLYGKNKKPSVAHLKGIDIVVFDIQDVGVRFYTYISTLHYAVSYTHLTLPTIYSV